MNKQIIHKIIATITVCSVGFLSASAMAGQDESQRQIVQRVMEAKQKQALALARQQTQSSPSVAGAQGEKGKLGPAGANAATPNNGCVFRNQRSGTC